MRQADLISDSETSSTGLDPIIAATLAYAFLFFSGILFLIFEKQSKYVRFHAVQSTVVFGGLFILSAFMGFLPLIGWFANIILGPVAVILWVLLMVKAYQGERFKLPISGDIAEKNA